MQFVCTGCYTYLSLSNGAKLADIPYDTYDTLIAEPREPQPECMCAEPKPQPVPILTQYIPPSPPYERPKDIRDTRNNDGTRNPVDNGRKR